MPLSKLISKKLCLYTDNTTVYRHSNNFNFTAEKEKYGCYVCGSSNGAPSRTMSRCYGPQYNFDHAYRFIVKHTFTLCAIFLLSASLYSGGLFATTCDAQQNYGAPLAQLTPKQMAYNEIAQYCEPSVYPFVKCKTNAKGGWDIMAGAYGAGVKATLYNNPNLGVQLMSNCRGMKGKRWLPRVEPSCMIDPTAVSQIEVFLKIVQATADKSNLRSQDKNTSALQKEIMRTRSGSQIDNPKLPELIEVFDLTTQAPHRIQNMSYSQALLDAIDADKVRREIIAIEIQNLFIQILRVNRGVNRGSNIKRILDQASKEIWMRLRLYFRLVDIIFVSTLALHRQGIFHCDLHYGNIMILKTYITDVHVLETHMREGTAVIPDISALYSSKITSSTIKRKLQQRHDNGKVGIPVYVLDPSQVRLIDAAYMLSIGEKQKASPAPCLLYRTRRQEDLNELYRGGLDYIFRIQLTEKDLFALALNRATDARKGQNPMNSAAAGHIEALKNLYSVAHRRLLDVHQAIVQVPELSNCRRVVKRTQMTDAMLNEGTIEEAAKYVDGSCTIDQQEAGIFKLMEIIQEYRTKVVPDCVDCQVAPYDYNNRQLPSLQSPTSDALSWQRRSSAS
eukprot:Lankesteria_metandrocarpae@DN8100_c0_g1_i1.p1